MLSRFHLIPERYRRTDRRTDLLYQYRASVCWRAIKIYDNMLSRFHLIPERYGQTDGRTDRCAISISRVKPTVPGCQRIPQRMLDKLVANSETGNMGLKKCPGLHALLRSVCHEVCPVRDCSAPVVHRQEEISGAATDKRPTLRN